MNVSKISFAALMAVFIFLPIPASAQLTWGTSGNGGTGTWDSSTLDWYTGSSNVAWVSGDAATFSGTGGTITVSGTQTAGQLTFSNPSGSYNLTGGTLNGTSSGLIVETDSDATINSTLGTVASLTKSGAGTLTLGGNNTYSGVTSINAGVLALGSSGALGSTGSITFNGGTLQYSSVNTSDYSGRIVNSVGAISIDTNGQNVTFASQPGASNTGGLTKLGSGTLTITAFNQNNLPSVAYSGSTTITAGTLQIGGASTDSYVNGPIVNNSTLVLNGFYVNILGLISGTGSVHLAGFSGLLSNSANTYTGITTIDSTNSNAALANGGVPSGIGESSNAAGNLIFGGGSLAITGSTDRLFTIGDAAGNSATLIASGVNNFTNTGAIAFGTSGAHTLTLGSTSAANATFVPSVSDEGAGSPTNLIKSGTGTWTLSGLNTYSGTTTISSGTLQLAQEDSLYGGITSNWTSTNIIVGKNTVLNLNVGGTGEFTSSDISSLTALGTSTGGFQSGSTIGLDTTNATGGNFTVSGTIGGGANTLNLTKLGANTLTLSGTNTYTGSTNIKAGTVNVGSAGALGGGGNIIFGGGTLQFSSANTTDYSSRIVNSASPVAIDTNGQMITFASALAASDTGGLTKLGSGTLVLTGVNNYTGGTTISAGTLQLGNGTSTSPLLGSGNVANNGALVFDAVYMSVPGVISGTGSVSTINVGSVDLQVGNTYTGVTTIDGSGAFFNGAPVNGGSLVVGALANGGSASSIGASSNAAANLVFGGGVLSYFGTTAQTTDRLFTIGDANGNSATIGSVGYGSVGGLNFTNTGAIAFGTAAPHDLVLAGGQVLNQFAPLISDQSPTNPTTLTVAGYWNITGNNTYTGGTTVLGEVRLGSLGAINTTGPIQMEGILQFTSANTTDYSSRFVQGTYTLYGADTNGQNVTFATGLTGNKPNNYIVIKQGAGTLTLTGDSTFTGWTQITGGTLQIGNGGTIGNLGTGNIIDWANLAYDRSDTIIESNSISGTPGAVSQIGTGTLILTGANTYTAGTTISTGTLQVGNGGTIGNLGTGGVTDNSALVYYRNDALSDGNLISGNGSVSQIGAGTTSLTNTSSTYTGSTIFDAGVLNIAALANGGSPSSVGSSSKAATNLIFGNGTLQFTGSSAQSTDRLFTIGDASGNTAIVDGSGTGSGTLNFAGTGSLAFGNASPHTLILTGTNTGANTFTPTISDQSAGNATSLTKTGTGLWVVNGANTFSGPTNINGGTLNVGSTGALGSVSAITFGGGTLQYSASNTTDYASRIVNSTSPITIDTNSQNITYASALNSSNTGGLSKVSGGSLTLSGTNTYTGATTIYQGDIVLGSTGALSSGPIAFDNGYLQYTAANTIDYSSKFANSMGAIAIDTNGQNVTFASPFASSNVGGFDKEGLGTLTITAANTVATPTLVLLGELDLDSATGPALGGDLNVGGGTAKFLLANQLSSTSSVYVTGGTVDIGATNQTAESVLLNSGSITGTTGVLTSNLLTFSSGTVSANLGGSGGLTKLDSGTVTLSGTNIYTGATNINAGILALGSSGALSSGNLTFGGGILEHTSSNTTDYSSRIVNSTGAIAVNTNGQNITFGSALAASNTGGLSKLGLGTLTLQASNFYTGPTVVSAGTLQLAKEVSLYNDNTANWTALNISVNSGATLALNVGGSGEFTASDISTLTALGATSNSFQSGSFIALDTTNAAGNNFTDSNTIANPYFGYNVLGITKLGANQLTLSGANTFSGGITVSAGTLVAGVSGVGLSSGAFGASNGTTSGVVTLGDASTTANNSSPTVLINGAYTVANPITVSSQATSGVYTIGGSNTTGIAIYYGNVVLNQPVTLSGATGGTVDFNTGIWTTNNKAIIVGTASQLGKVEIDSAVTTTGGVTVQDGTFDVGGPLTANVVIGPGGTLSSTASGNVTGNVTMSNTGAINLNSSSVITGTLGVTGSNWLGAGRVTGTVTLNGGIFSIGPGANLTGNGGLNVVSGTISGGSTAKITASIDYTSAISGTFGGVIAGTGNSFTLNSTLDRNGTTFTLSGANTYTGGTTLIAGTLVAANAASFGSIGAAVNLQGGTLDLATTGQIRPYTVTVSGNTTIESDRSTLSAGITQPINTLSIGADTLTIAAGPNVSGGTPLISSGATKLNSTTGAISVINPTSAGMTITNVTGVATTGKTDILDLDGTATGNQVTGVIGNGIGGGTVGLSKTNTSTWTVSGANTFTGSVAVNAGTLAVNTVAMGSTAQALGKGAAVSLGVSGVSAGTLQYTGGTGTLDKNITALGNGTIQNSGGGALTLSGTLTKANSVLTFGGGTINVTGQITGGTTSNFNSDLVVNNGTSLTLSNSNNNYTGPTSVYGGSTLTNGIDNALPIGTTLTLGASGETSATTNTYNLNGHNQSIGALSSSGNGANVVTNTGTSTLTLTGVNSDGVAVNGNFSGSIQDGTGKTSLSITGGTHVLTGTNTYTGGTLISGGTLLSDSSSGFGAGAISVGSGGSLGGSGVIKPTSTGAGVTMFSGSTLLSGDISSGTTAGNGLTLDNTIAKGTIFDAGSGNVTLAFNLGSGSTALVGSTPNQHPFDFSNPNTDSSYMKVLDDGGPDSVGELKFATGDIIDLTDLTGGNLQLELATPYLLIQANNNADYAGLITSGDFGGLTNQNGWVQNLDLKGTGTDYPDVRLYLFEGNLEVVPEPGTWAMLLLSLPLLFLKQIRRKIHQSK